MAAIGSDIKTTLSRPGYFGTMMDVAPVSWVPATQASMTDAARPTMRAEGGLARDARSEVRLHDTRSTKLCAKASATAGLPAAASASLRSISATPTISTLSQIGRGSLGRLARLPCADEHIFGRTGSI